MKKSTWYLKPYNYFCNSKYVGLNSLNFYCSSSTGCTIFCFVSTGGGGVGLSTGVVNQFVVGCVENMLNGLGASAKLGGIFVLNIDCGGGGCGDFVYFFSYFFNFSLSNFYFSYFSIFSRI